MRAGAEGETMVGSMCRYAEIPESEGFSDAVTE
jgi:hypothetical protein